MAETPHRWVKGVVLAASTLLVLLLGEAVVRVVKPQPLPSQEALREWILRDMYVVDERAGYRGAPDFEGTVRRYKVSTDFRSNSLGLRSAEPDDARRPRVLVLGDSNTWGWGVEQGTEWAAVIEQELQASHPGLQVVNAGTSGYGTINSLGLFQQIGPGLRPDLVLLAFYPNDYADNLVGLGAYTVEEGFLFDARSQAYWRDKPLLRFSHLLRLFNSVADGVGVKWFGGIPTGRIGRDFNQAHLARAGTLSASLIREVRDQALEMGARFGVVWLPSKEYASKGRRIPIHDRLKASVRKAGIPSVDIREPMLELPDLTGYYIPGDGHFDAPAHLLIGQHVARFVQEQGLLRGDSPENTGELSSAPTAANDVEEAALAADRP